MNKESLAPLAHPARGKVLLLSLAHQAQRVLPVRPGKTEEWGPRETMDCPVNKGRRDLKELKVIRASRGRRATQESLVHQDLLACQVHLDHPAHRQGS